MKKHLLLACTLVTLLLSVATAQTPKAPQSFSFQAVARDASGNVLTNKTISLRMSILNNAAAVYTETFTVNTNAYGMFTVTLGNGSVVTGSFSSVNWEEGSTSPKSLKVELDPAGGSAYTDMGSTTFNSVPYALVSDRATNMSLDHLTDVSVSSPAINQVLQWNGTAWVAATISNTIQTNSTLSGDGSAANPLKLASQSATNGQVLQYNGTTWVPATVSGGTGDNWGTQVIQKTVTLDGNGTAASPLTIAKQGANTGESLLWNGSLWTPGRPAISTDGVFTGQGTSASPLKLGQQGAAFGDVLRWNGTTWVPGAPFSLPYNGSGTGAAGMAAFFVSNPSTYGSPSVNAIDATANGGDAIYGTSDPATGKGVHGRSQHGTGIYGWSQDGSAGFFDGTVAVLGQLKVYGANVSKSSDYLFFDQSSNLSVNANTTTAVTGLDGMAFTVGSTASVSVPAKVIFTFNTPLASTSSNSSSGEDFQFQLIIKQGSTVIKQVNCTDNIKALGTRSFSYTMHCPVTAPGNYTATVQIFRNTGGLGTITVSNSQVQIQVINP
jgi:hypothetical protein